MQDNCRTCDKNTVDCPHASDAAEVAVKKVFAILGVDVDIPKEVEDFRENLRFGATLRRVADKGLLAMIGAVAVAIMAALWAGIVHQVGGR